MNKNVIIAIVSAGAGLAGGAVAGSKHVVTRIRNYFKTDSLEVARDKAEKLIRDLEGYIDDIAECNDPYDEVCEYSGDLKIYARKFGYINALVDTYHISAADAIEQYEDLIEVLEDTNEDIEDSVNDARIYAKKAAKRAEEAKKAAKKAAKEAEAAAKAEAEKAKAEEPAEEPSEEVANVPEPVEDPADEKSKTTKAKKPAAKKGAPKETTDAEEPKE